MTASRATHFGRTAVRVVWGALALIHAPIVVLVTARLAVAGVEPALLAKAGALLLATSIFVLKTVDPRFLRIGTPAQNLVLILLCGALVHREALRTPVGDPVPPAAVLVTATLLSDRVRRLVPLVAGLIAAGRAHLLPRPTLAGYATDSTVDAPRPTRLTGPCPPRGPPSAIVS
jgi:hypothetical protein